MTKKLTDTMQNLYDRLEKLGKWKEGALVWGLFTILVFGVVCLTGTLTSGFHLVDDWEFAHYIDSMTLNGQSFWDCLKETVAADLNLRFRPLYFVNRVCIAAIFGINLTAISIVKACEIVIALAFLYYCARWMHCNVVYAFLFALTVMTGYQSVVWWKLGPQESYGIMIFAIGFYLLLRYLRSEKKHFAILSVIAFFLMSLYKEPFVLTLPFVMLYTVYEQMKGKKVTIKNLWNAIKARLPYLLAVGLIFSVVIFIIVFFIGTNTYSYVGVDLSLSLDEYKPIWSRAFQTELKWYVRFGILMLLIMITFWEDLKKLGWEILLTLSFILPQVVLYSRSAITERYILPFAFGFAFFFVIVGCRWKALAGKRRIVYMLCLLLMLAAHGRAALREAKYFTYRGNSIQTMLDSTLEYTKTHEDARVLTCFYPNTEGNYTMHYWMRLHGFEDVYYWIEEPKLLIGWYEMSVLDQVLDPAVSFSSQYTVDDMDIVVMYNREDRHWCYEPSLDLSGFEEHKCGTLTVYTKRD